MRTLKIICTVCGVGLGAASLLHLLSFDIAMPLMFMLIICLNLICAKECHDKADKSGALLYLGVAMFLAIVILYNLANKFM